MASQLVLGDWVIRRSQTIEGIGPYQVIEVDGNKAVVVAGARPDARFDQRIEVKLRDVQKIENLTGISIWFPRENHRAWEHGVVLAGGETTWQVRIDSSKDGIYPIPFRNHLLADGEKSLWIKDFRLVPNPFEMLSLGMATRLKELNVARGFRRWINDQNHASSGFSAIMAAPVRPAHHQLNAMARVLGDPTLRFLLADEVGLGKTIEASLVLKQLLLDKAVSRAVVAVPRQLRLQWVQELQTKFILQPQIESGEVRVITHDELTADISTDFLIVDEAHRFCRGERHESLFDELRQLSRKTERLLLISATPMRSDPYMLLQLLHLIDDSNYRLADESEFKERLAIRVKQSNALRLLKPSQTPDQRKYLTNALRENTPLDLNINVLLATIENGESDSSQLETAISTLRTEIEERFRISRRIIRNRRSAINIDDYPLSGRSHQFIKLSPKNVSMLSDFLESWRCRSLDRSWNDVEPTFTTLLEHVLGGSVAVRHWIDVRLESLHDKSSTPAFDGEKHLLGQYKATIQIDDLRARFFADYFESSLTHPVNARDISQKMVLCSGYSMQAKEIFEVLYAKFGPRIVAHLVEQSDEENDKSVRKFSDDPDVRVLVVDSGAEEGLNLQVARTLINVDLPWSVNRLEQRLGRLDRFAAGHIQDVVCVVLVEEGNQLLAEYLDFLNRATGIFEDSVATAQQSLAQVMRELAKQIWESGVALIAPDFEEVRTRIETEKEEVEELEDIESESSFGNFLESNYRNLQVFEEQWSDTQKVIDKVTGSNGGLGIHRRPLVDDSKIYRYVIADETRIPKTLTGVVSSKLSSRATCSRPLALLNPGTQLLRVGNTMIDYFDEFLRRDDIGRVSVGWLKDIEMFEPYVDFSIECLVSPDFEFLRKLIPISDLKRVRRRIGTALQPQILELRLNEKADSLDPESPVWTSETKPVYGKKLIDLFDRRGTFNSALNLIEDSIELIVKTKLANEIESALVATNRDTVRRINSLKIWQQGNVVAEIELEEKIGGEIDFGLRNPKIQVLSIVAVVHSWEELAR